MIYPCLSKLLAWGNNLTVTSLLLRISSQVNILCHGILNTILTRLRSGFDPIDSSYWRILDANPRHESVGIGFKKHTEADGKKHEPVKVSGASSAQAIAILRSASV